MRLNEAHSSAAIYRSREFEDKRRYIHLRSSTHDCVSNVVRYKKLGYLLVVVEGLEKIDSFECEYSFVGFGPCALSGAAEMVGSLGWTPLEKYQRL